MGSLKFKNVVLQTKWLWRFPFESNSLWHKVIKSRYDVSANGWDANYALRCSSRSPWKDISSGYEMFLNGCVFEVGGGTRVKFWEDDWNRCGVLSEVFPRLFALSRKHELNISSFVVPDTVPHSWDFGFRRNLNEVEIGEVVRMMDILNGVRLVPYRLDKRRWKCDPSGTFSCHSFSSLIENAGEGEVFLLTIKFGKQMLLRRSSFLFGRQCWVKLILVMCYRDIVPICTSVPTGVPCAIWREKVWITSSFTALSL